MAQDIAANTEGPFVSSHFVTSAACGQCREEDKVAQTLAQIKRNSGLPKRIPPKLELLQKGNSWSPGSIVVLLVRHAAEVKSSHAQGPQLHTPVDHGFLGT